MIKKIFNRGFTLIETMVAVLLLASAIAGPLTIAAKGLTAALVAKNQITAFYLAQDAMEQVRFLRDSACLAAGSSPNGCASNVWLSSLASCVSVDGTASCKLDSLGNSPTSPTACDGANCSAATDVLRFDTNNNSFNYNPAASVTVQHFIRVIHIKNDPTGTTPDEAVVTVQVSWNDVSGVTHAPITVRENLFRWQ